MTCAALLAAYFGGAQIADLDTSRVYDVPAAKMAEMTVAERAIARGCALRYGIRYRVVKDR